MDIGTFQIIGNEYLLRTGRDCKTVRGKLDRPYSGVASETSPEKVIVAGDFVADDIRVNGVRNVLGRIVHEFAVRIGQRIDILDIGPCERACRTVGDSYAAGAPLRIVPMSFGIVEAVAPVYIFNVRCPDSGVRDPLRSFHPAECISYEFPVHHILGTVNRQVNHVRSTAHAVLGAVGIEISGPLPVIEN